MVSTIDGLGQHEKTYACKRGKPLSERQRHRNTRNTRTARTRPRAGYVFAAIHQMGGKGLHGMAWPASTCTTALEGCGLQPAPPVPPLAECGGCLPGSDPPGNRQGGRFEAEKNPCAGAPFRKKPASRPKGAVFKAIGDWEAGF